MNILIAEANTHLASLWKRHMARSGAEVILAHTAEDALDQIDQVDFQVIVLDVMLDGGAALSVADFANYRRPEARVIFVTSSSFFSDGSIFQISPNACAFLPCSTSPADLATMVEHYARAQ
ncbi:response regulator [Tropicibacter alexandrii]|uniref:response regulator n=1 Tax=Tropicibacter alexandrii TaxID=2267683 RepID=UPI000EF506DE|nr:response regulator [Tropicibacter alexandrii]